MALNPSLTRAVTRALNPSLTRAVAGGAPAGAGAIELIGITVQWENVAADGSMTALVPEGTEDGHQMLMHIGIQDDVQILTDPPTGWIKVTALDKSTTGGDDLRANVYRRTADSEPASYEVTQNHAASLRQLNVVISTWANVRADIFDVTPDSAHAAVTQNVVNPSNPAIASLTDDALMICFGVWGFEALTTVGAQDGYAILAEDHSNGVGCALSSKTLDTAGLETPGPWTHTSAGTPESIHNSLILRHVDAPGDAYFDNVTLLLDFAGADEGTDTTDLSSIGHVETFITTCELDTDETFLGENTLLPIGANGRLEFPDHISWEILAGVDFTWECGVRFISTAGTQSLLSNFDGSVGAWIRCSGGKIIFVNTGVGEKEEDWVPSPATWYHVAVSRTGGQLRTFIDGVQLGTPTAWDAKIWQGTTGFNVGAARVSTESVNGNIGAVRITKGVGRYTENFTPPTEFYPTER